MRPAVVHSVADKDWRTLAAVAAPLEPVNSSAEHPTAEEGAADFAMRMVAVLGSLGPEVVLGEDILAL